MKKRGTKKLMLLQKLFFPCTISAENAIFYWCFSRTLWAEGWGLEKESGWSLMAHLAYIYSPLKLLDNFSKMWTLIYLPLLHLKYKAYSRSCHGYRLQFSVSRVLDRSYWNLWAFSYCTLVMQCMSMYKSKETFWH